jgi:hypothetical protein
MIMPYEDGEKRVTEGPLARVIDVLGRELISSLGS